MRANFPWIFSRCRDGMEYLHHSEHILSAISTVFLKRNTVEIIDKMGLKRKKHSIVVGKNKVLLQGNHIALLFFFVSEEHVEWQTKMRMNVVPVLFETPMQAQQPSLFGMEKAHFPCQQGFQLASKFPLEWRRWWDLEGQGNRLAEAEGPVGCSTAQVPVCSSFDTQSCVKPFLQFRKAETSSTPLNYWQHPSTAVSAAALSQRQRLQCSSPALPCSLMGTCSCRTGSSSSQSPALVWELHTLKIKQ